MGQSTRPGTLLNSVGKIRSTFNRSIPTGPFQERGSPTSAEQQAMNEEEFRLSQVKFHALPGAHETMQDSAGKLSEVQVKTTRLPNSQMSLRRKKDTRFQRISRESSHEEPFKHSAIDRSSL